MPLRNYGLLTGLVNGFGPQGGGNPHHLLDVSADKQQYSIAINLGPSSRSIKSDMQFQFVPDLQRAGSAAKALISKIKNVSAFRVRETTPNLPTLDYIHGQIIEMKDFRPLPSGAAKSSQFGKKIADLAHAVSGNSDAFVAVFGTGYPDQDDRITGHHQQINPLQDSFGFTGVDNVHMNQGSYYRVGGHSDAHFHENGPDQDGAVFFFLPGGQVTGLFVKFTSQDDDTDAFGNPLKTGIAELDAKGAIPPRVRKKLTRVRVLRRPGAASAIPAPTPEDVGLPGGATPVASGVPTGGFIFADPASQEDPGDGTFKPDDDKEYRNSPFVAQFNNGVPEPVPGPLHGNYPTMDLGDVLGAAAIRKIQDAGQLVFHMVGDTGAPALQKLKGEDSVANLMASDFDTKSDADRPKFFFHLGDVVYFYGEPDYYYSQFYKPYQNYPAPIFAIPGNHDGITYDKSMESLAGFKAAFCDTKPQHWKAAGGITRTTMTQPGVWFTLDAPYVSIIGLYSNCAEGPGYLDDQQLLFFYKELTRLKADRQSGKIAAILLAVHHPPISFTSTKPSSTNMSKKLDDACNQAGIWPDAVLSGHTHFYQRATRMVGSRQIPYIIAGSGGYDDDSDKPHTKNSLQQRSSPVLRLDSVLYNFGYLRLILKPKARGQSPTLRIEYRSPSNQGQAADSCVLDLSRNVLV
jgi:uncharacterized protein YukJ